MAPRSRPSSTKPETSTAGNGERLQKVLASAGLGSRRQCEELITDGRIEVDRRVVTELGTRVDVSRQEVRIDGEPLKRSKRVYFALNKPPGVVSTNRDPSGRPRVVDLIVSNDRLFTVGRLDMSSEGLIIVTNDGALANNLAHPRYGVDKIYHVQVAGSPAPEHLLTLRKGVHLAEGFVRVKEVHVKQRLKQSTVLEIVLSEGKNREIRRVMARIGHKVLRLKRIAIGPVRLGDLPLGAHRQLTALELRRLKALAAPGQAAQDAKPKSRRPKSRSGPGEERTGKPGGARGRGKPTDNKRTKAGQKPGQKPVARPGSQKKAPKRTPTSGSVIDYDPPVVEEAPKPRSSGGGKRRPVKKATQRGRGKGQGKGKSKRKPRR
jgi:23S rRNA pseudouridine2605 synthase